jgi:glycine reductase complex component B subunit gamma
MIRVVHYVNQFFAKIGGEEKADVPLAVMKGPVGPGVALENEMKGAGKVTSTIYAGDNFANEHSKEFVEAALEKLKEIHPDVIVAGPAFNAGRYGSACGLLLKAAREKLGIPGVTGLGPDNPGVEMFRSSIYIVPTSGNAAGMLKALPILARLALRLGGGGELGPADEEGYLARGIRHNIATGINPARRAVEMAIARVKGRPFRTELAVIPFDRVEPPPPIQDLSKATIALVTEGGIVPVGNRDHLETRNANKWFHYRLAESDFKKGDLEAWHGGHITEWVNEDPDRNVPLDAMRSLEKAGKIGKLYDEYCVTTGNAGNITKMRRIGAEIAAYLKEKHVDGAVLTAT